MSEVEELDLENMIECPVCHDFVEEDMYCVICDGCKEHCACGWEIDQVKISLCKEKELCLECMKSFDTSELCFICSNCPNCCIC